MIMEIAALRARPSDLEEENLNLEKPIRKEVQEEDEDLVKTLFMACLHMEVSDMCRTSGSPVGSGCRRARGGCTRKDPRRDGLCGHKNSPALNFLCREQVSRGLSLFYHDRH